MPVIDMSFSILSHASTPVVGHADGAVFTWPGIALSASIQTLNPFLFAGSKILFARWVLVWNPKANDIGYCSVKFVACDDGPSNIQQIGYATKNNYTSPMVTGVLITDELNAVWQAKMAANTHFHVGHQTGGNGHNGPEIFQSRVEMAVETV